MDEHGPFIANLPIKDGDFPWFSIVVLVYWRVMLQIISDQHPHINPKNTSCLNLFSGEDRMGLCFSSVSKDLDFIFILSQWNIQPWPTFTQWKHWEYPPFRSISLESSRELVSFRGGTLKSIQIDWGLIYYLTTMFFSTSKKSQLFARSKITLQVASSLFCCLLSAPKSRCLHSGHQLLVFGPISWWWQGNHSDAIRGYFMVFLQD